MTASNCQVNRLTYRRLRETLAALIPLGIQTWRCQLTAPMGGRRIGRSGCSNPSRSSR